MDMNTNNKKLESALDYSIKLLESGASIEDCLKLYPGQRTELRQLLEAVTLVKKSYPERGEVRPSKLFLKTDRERFLSAIEGGIPIMHELSLPAADQEVPGKVVYLFKKAYAALIASAAALILVSGGLVYTAAGSVPGNTLYPVKRTAERVQLALTFDTAKKAELRYDFAQKRTVEAKKLAKAGNANEAARVYKEAKDDFAKAQELAKTSGTTLKGKAGLDGTKPKATGDTLKVAENINQQATDDSKKNIALEIAPTTTTTIMQTLAEDKNAEANKAKAVKDAEEANKALAERLAQNRKDRRERQEKAAEEAEKKALASVPPFKIKSMSVSGLYMSPNGDGVKDSVNIAVRGTSDGDFNIWLYQGSEKIALLKTVKDDKNVKFEWFGISESGDKVADGTYTIVAVDNIGQTASQKASVIIDTRRPRIRLMGPPDGISTENPNPQFVWVDTEDDNEYTLVLASEDGGKREIAGISNTFHDLNKALQKGVWTWNIVAVDKAGNVGVSKRWQFTVKAVEEQEDIATEQDKPVTE